MRPAQRRHQRPAHLQGVLSEQDELRLGCLLLRQLAAGVDAATRGVPVPGEHGAAHRRDALRLTLRPRRRAQLLRDAAVAELSERLLQEPDVLVPVDDGGPRLP
jgi:hypothetical protein